MTVTFRAAAGLAGGADVTSPFASPAFTLPTGHTTDDLLLAVCGWKPYDTTWDTLTGYASEIGPITSGTTGSGVGTGSVAAQVWTKTHSGSESAQSLTVLGGAGGFTPAMRAMIALYKTNAGAWTVDSTSGTSETTTLNVNGAGSLAWAAGDMAVVVVVHKDDDATHASPALTASGVTFANLTQQLATTTAINGDDGAMYVYTADVTAGATAAPNFTATVGASEGWASVIFLRIAEPASPATGTVAVTLAAATSAASGTFTPQAVTGTSAQTLAPATSTASGTFTPQAVTGTVAVTLAASTSAAAGTFTPQPVTGTSAQTLAAATSSASGTATDPPVSGTVAVTLAPATSTASGTATDPPVSGTVAVTLAPATSSASGTFVSVAGTVAVTLTAATSTASGTWYVPSYRTVTAQRRPDRTVTQRRPDRTLTGSH